MDERALTWGQADWLRMYRSLTDPDEIEKRIQRDKQRKWREQKQQDTGL